MSSDLKRSIRHTLLNEELPSWETIIQFHLNLIKHEEYNPYEHPLNIYASYGCIELPEIVGVELKYLYLFPLTEDEILDIFYQRFPKHQFIAQSPQISDPDEFRWVWMLSDMINDYESNSDNMYLLIIMNADTGENSILPVVTDNITSAVSRYREHLNCEFFYDQANDEIYPHGFIALVTVSAEARIDISKQRRVDINDPWNAARMILNYKTELCQPQVRINDTRHI